MNLMLNTFNPGSAPAATSPAPVAGNQALPDMAAPGAAAALPFAQWFGQQADFALAAGDAAEPVAHAGAEAGVDDARDVSTADAAATPAAAPDSPPLAAMAMPLMALPVPAAAAAAALAMAMPLPLPVAQPGARAESTKPAPDAAAATPVDGSGARAVARDALPALAAEAPIATAAAGPIAGAVGPAPAPAATPATAPAPATATATDADAAPAGAGQAAPAGPAKAAFAVADAGTPEAQTSAPVAANSTAFGIHGAAVAAPQPAAAGTLTLAGPPAAWRQTLHEALGERLQLQVGNNLEQAVIRLDPPNLGRVEIAIRHAAGSLEVTLSATNGEVLRQLHSVSDNLRNDLAQRQFTEVAVTVVAPAPRSAAANPFAGEQQGRGRQGGREQEDHHPGLALADAGNPASTFSLNGRE